MGNKIRELEETIERLRLINVKLTRERDQAERTVKELLWDDPGDIPAFGSSFGDLLSYLNHQDPFPADMYEMVKVGAIKWMQLKDDIAALRLQISETAQLKRALYNALYKEPVMTVIAWDGETLAADKMTDFGGLHASSSK